MVSAQERYIAMLEGREIPAYTPPHQNDSIYEPPQAFISNRALLSRFMEENGLTTADVMAALSEVQE